MANTSARMLRLLTLLQTHRHWPGDELAARLEISQRTLRRDIERLRELGYPVDASRGLDGGYQLRAGAALPPLLLDDDEAVAIAVGLRTAAAGAIAGVEDTAVRALTKVIHVMPQRLRHRVSALQAYTVPGALGGAPTVDAVDLTVLAQACRDSERVQFDYAKRDGDRAQRLVEPLRLVSLGQRWYLVAWDLDRHDWRSFRVDRLTSPETTGARFRPRELPASDAAAFVQAGITASTARHDVEVRVNAPAADVAQIVGRWGEVDVLDASTCTLRMTVDDLSWLTLVLGAVGAEFTVVTPVELNSHLERVGALFTRATA